MISLRQELLTKLFREFSNVSSYESDMRSSSKAETIGRIYKTVEKYIELEYTNNIIDYYKKLNLVSLEERAYQRNKDVRNKKIIEQRKKNLKFIKENGLVEHPKYKGYYGTKESRVFSSKGAYGAIQELKPIYQKCNNSVLLSIFRLT